MTFTAFLYISETTRTNFFKIKSHNFRNVCNNVWNFHSDWFTFTPWNFKMNLQSWTKVTQVQPLPSPHKQCWTRVSRFFSEIQLCIGWGEGELQENFENDAVLRGRRKWWKNMHIAVMSQGLLSRIVAYAVKNLRYKIHSFDFMLMFANCAHGTYLHD